MRNGLGLGRMTDTRKRGPARLGLLEAELQRFVPITLRGLDLKNGARAGLFTIAEPTAAVRELQSEYKQVMDNLLTSVEPEKPVLPKKTRKRSSRRAPSRKRRS